MRIATSPLTRAEPSLQPVAFRDAGTHFTVAHVRAAFGIDEPPVGLGDGIAAAFDGVTLRYRHDP